MKSDSYLTLCLEQALNSPLRYRHGCIIVRGGKVIGQGFNDHRAGFSGGALKTGRLPVHSVDSAALATLKKKHRLKRELNNLQEEDTNTFMPFENMTGGGKLANTPLSMHSEMMAIHSALSASSTLASSAVSYQKPYFKLSSGSKRKARLRQDAVKAYVETVCKAALAQSAAEHRPDASQVQGWQFEGSAPQSRTTGSYVSTQGERDGHSRAPEEEYGETPNEESEALESQQWKQSQQTRTQQRAPTIYA
jgi:deoxycytidylate deaminase